MLKYYLIFLAVALAALALPVAELGEQAAQVVIQPLRWRTQFSTIKAHSFMTLEWTGGAGEVELYYIPQWPEQLEYDLITIANTTESSYDWEVPEAEAYPEGATMIIGVKNKYGSGNAWYDLSPSVPFQA